MISALPILIKTETATVQIRAMRFKRVLWNVYRAGGRLLRADRQTVTKLMCTFFNFL
jgi:hypothetical protein